MTLAGRCWARALLIATVLPWLSRDARAQGSLEAIRRAAQGNSSDQDEDDDKPRRRKRRADCDDDHSGLSVWVSDTFGGPIFAAVAAPWWIPAAAVGDDYSTTAAFPPAPYAHESGGYLNFDPRDDDWTRPFSLHYASEYATDFGGLDRVGGRLQVDSSMRLGLDTEWNLWREDVIQGHDSLWTGDANLVFRFAQSEHSQWYTGLGVNWLSGAQSDAGFNFTYGFDWFPAKPVIVRSVLDAGTIGDAGLLHSKTTLGIIHRRLEVFTGYDLLRIGDTNLHGVIAGFTIWY